MPELRDLIDRRSMIIGGAAIGVAARPLPALADIPQGFTRMPIWPKDVPGAKGVTVVEGEVPRTPQSGPLDTLFMHVTRPTLTVFRPAKSNGAALLLIPGGGYVRVAIGHEGFTIAQRFAAMGFTCFSLVYRMPGDGWGAGPEAPLQDAQRALRIVRSQAGQYGFDPARIGVIGFSAGGHLAAWLTSRQGTAYAPQDAIDREPLAPRVAGLLYPVISMMAPYVHMGSRDQLLGRAPTPERQRLYSMQTDIAPGTPPTFLAHALDDASVPVENSLEMLAGLRATKISAEAHLFDSGGHGFGLALPDGAPSPWPELFAAFARRHGL
jgi:acetyl esterase/lipase